MYGQSRVGDWESYTSFLKVRQTVEINRKIICATSGGILILDRESESFEMLTNIDGLAETDLSAITVDKNGHLWIGSSSPRGIIQIYDIEKKQAVKTFDFNLSQVTDIAASDSVVFVAYSKNLDWGILEFVWHEGKFIYRQIYNPSQESLDYITNLTIRGDSLFAATNLGLFVGDFQRYILNYPQNWNILSGFPLNSVTVLKAVDSEILIVASGEIWSYTDTLRQVSVAESSLLDVTRSNDGTLYGLTKWKLVRFNELGEIVMARKPGARCRRLETLNDGNLLIATDRGFAIWRVDREGFEWYTPNTLISNVYSAMAVLDDGRLVAVGREGISVLTEYGWYNVVPSNSMWAIRDHDPGDFSAFVADTVQFKSSRVWSLLGDGDRILMSLQGVVPDTNEFGYPIGGGIINIDLTEPSELVVYDTTGGFINPYNDIGYMNVRGLFIDSEKNLWISNFGAADLDKKITVLAADGHWFHIPQTGSGGIPQKLENPTDIVVVERNVILMGSSKDDGIFVLKMDHDSDNDGVPDVLDGDADNDGIPKEEDDDDDGNGILDEDDVLPVRWVNFSVNQGLVNNTVWSLVSPEPDIAWILTAQGLQRLTFSSEYSRITPYFFTYFSGVPFGEGSKVIMDGRENVWVSSITSGLYVLLANATPWPNWNGFSHSNSYLLSDEVTAVAFDNKRGVAYIATSKGINSLRIPFAEERKTYDHVTVFPSPFRIPSTTPMVIDGLMDNSSLKIVMLSGRVLRDIKLGSPSIRGYQAFWDGKTDSGDYVGTGVYLVAIYSETGESYVTKIAVIRE